MALEKGTLVTGRLKRVVLYLLLPRPGAITGGSIYFWGGVAYAATLHHGASIVEVAAGWFCTEFLINQAKYWLNDYRDASSDRFHPRKKERAPASGHFPVEWLPFLFALRAAAGLAFLFWFWPQAVPFALLLPAIQLLYDAAKRVPLLNGGVAAWGSVVRFACGYATVAGGGPPVFSCALVYSQRLAIYIAAYSAEGRYLLNHGITPGKEYTLFYARHPYLEKVAMASFLGLLAFALNQSLPGGVVVAGVLLALCGVLYYRINGPGDRIYWEGWRVLWAILTFVSRQLSEQFRSRCRQNLSPRSPCAPEMADPRCCCHRVGPGPSRHRRGERGRLAPVGRVRRRY